jgi:small subunit ribosomal protein S27e
MVQNGRSKFVRIECPRCGQEKVVFGKSSSRVKCGRCNRLLVAPGGGKTRVKAKVREVL